jgi:signal transduction histidine kinase/CheY-like chemotaxis protein
MFAGTDYEIIAANFPAEGIEILDADPTIQVILLDLEFIEGSYVELLDHIKASSKNYRVIVLTGHDELLSFKVAEDYDIFHYLPKATRSAKEATRFSVAQAFRDLEHANLAQKVDRVLDVQARINANESPRNTLDLICRSVREIVGAYTCHIRVYDFRLGDFHLQGFDGPEPELELAFREPKPKGNLFSGRVVDSRVAEVYDDLQALDDFRQFKEAALARQISPPERHYFEQVASAYIVPISTGLFGDLVDAVLNVSSDRKAYFTEEKRALVNEFVSQAALAVTKDWLQKKRMEAHEDYGRISTMLGAMSGAAENTNDLQSIYDVVTDNISKIVNAEIISVFRYDPSTDLVANVAEIRGGRKVTDFTERYARGESLTGHVFQDDTTIHLPKPDDPNPVNPSDDPRYDRKNEAKYLKKIPSGELKHYLAVPVHIDGKVHGVLRAVNKKSNYYDEGPPDQNRRCLLERGFSKDCRNVMEITASHLAVAIRNIELLEEKDRQVDQIRTLAEVARAINSEMNIDEVLKGTIRKMSEFMQAEICMLFLMDESEEHVQLRQVVGIPETLIPNATYALGEGVTGEVAKTGGPQLIRSAPENNGKYDPEITAYLTAVHGEPTKITSLMAVPIQARGRVLGVMKVINKNGDHQKYNERDLEWFKTFADYVSIAIANAQIYKHNNDRLAVAERNYALSLIVSAVAHEINNTSGVIPANVDGIRSYLPEAGDEINKMLDTITDAATQATDFANELAGFSANRTGERRSLDINQVIQETKEGLDYQDSLKATAAELILDLSPQPLRCMIYRTPFMQIVRNIIINAAQALAGQPGGRISVTAKEGIDEAAGKAVIRFSDNGPGIKTEFLSKIFDPDFTTKPKGNGIGLWLVKTQLELIQGSIKVESVYGQGATFTIRIPLAPAEAGGTP